MSYKLIQKSLQQAIDRRNKQENVDDQSSTQNLNNSTKNKSTTRTLNEQDLLKLQVKSMLSFDKHSIKSKSQKQVVTKRAQSFKHAKQSRKKINAQTLKPNALILNSRSSSSVYSSKKMKNIPTVTKQKSKREREKKSIEELAKQLKKLKNTSRSKTSEKKA